MSDFDGPFNFVTGGNYFHDSFNNRAMFSVGLTSLIPNLDADTGSFIRARRRGQPRHPRDLRLPVPGRVAESRRVRRVLGRQLRDHRRLQGDRGHPLQPGREGLPALRRRRRTVHGAHRSARRQAGRRQLHRHPLAVHEPGGILPNQYDGRHIPLPLSAYGNIVDANEDWSKPTYRLVFDYRTERLGHVLPELRDRLPVGRVLRDLRHPDALRVRPRDQRQHRTRLQGRPARQHAAPERRPVLHQVRRPAARSRGDLHGR